MEIIQKALCKVDYEYSKIVVYPATSKFAGHRYLELTLRPKEPNIFMLCGFEDKYTYHKKFFPRIVNNTIDVEAEKMLCDAFHAKQLPDIYVGQAVISIPPTYMKVAGNLDFVKDSTGQNIVYTTIKIVVLLNENGSLMEDENDLSRRADTIRAARIKEGVWAPAPAQVVAASEVTGGFGKVSILNRIASKMHHSNSNRMLSILYIFVLWIALHFYLYLFSGFYDI